MKFFKVAILVFIVYSIITFIMTFPTVFNLDTHFYGPMHGTDYRGALRHTWWVKYAFQNNLNWRIDNMINFPFGDSYDWPIFSPLWQLCVFPLSIIFNEQVGFNMLFFFSFILSGLTMFLLAFYLTKDYKSSFFAGLIYSFCPYHFNKIWEHLGPALIEWLPLYVLFLLKMVKDNARIRNIFYCSIALSLVFFTDFYFAYFMIIFTFGLLLFITLFSWKKKIYSFLNKRWYEFKNYFFNDLKVYIKAFFVFFLTFFLTLPATFSIIKTILFVQKSDLVMSEGFVRDFNYLFSQAALPLNYFLPASVHPIFGNFARSIFGTIFYGRGSIEQTLYLGFVPMLFAFIAYRAWKKKRASDNIFCNSKDNFFIGFFIFSVVFTFLFSLPPFFNLGLFKIYFPSNFMYKFFPMFRAYARFGILVMLCVSVLAAYGLKFIFESITSKRKRTLLLILVSLIVLFEFTNIPPLRATDVSKVPGVYKWLSQQQGNFAIAEYPLGQSATGGGEGYRDLDYLFYQRFHQKPMVEGAKPGTPASKIKQKILRITDPTTPKILSELGVRYVILHLDKYRELRDSEAVEILGEVPDLSKSNSFKLIKKFGPDEIYEIKILKSK